MVISYLHEVSVPLRDTKIQMIKKTEWKYDISKMRNYTFYLNKIDNHLSASQNVKTSKRESQNIE